jgi:molecular chaperone DnaK
MKCGRDTLATVVMDFDALFPASPISAASLVHDALTLLLSVEPVSDGALEAGLRLANRQGDVAQIRDVEHRICLSIARRGDSDKLISKLLDRRRRGLLGKQETEEVVKVYLLARGFEVASPWVGFFGQLPQDQLPHVHQVHAILGRYGEAAEIAEEDGDFRSALRYLLESPGLDAARRAITLSEQRVPDPEYTIRAHRRAGDALWQQREYLTAAGRFGAHERLPPELWPDRRRD